MKLIQPVINALQDDRWFVSLVDIKSENFFRIKVYNENEQYGVRVYIWNLLPVGGARRPAEEYRIQITGAEQFEAEPNEKTLILGWWREGEVFAGFDFNKHNGALGLSPSIQIREEALRKAHVKGIAI